MKENVDDSEIDCFRYVFRAQFASVTLDLDDAWVLLQLPSKLADVYIDRVNAHRAALQQTIRKATVGSADVEADLIRDASIEKSSSAPYNFSPARLANLGLRLETDIFADSAIAVPGLSTRTPSTDASPASMTACAFESESASPRSSSKLIEVRILRVFGGKRVTQVRRKTRNSAIERSRSAFSPNGASHPSDGARSRGRCAILVVY